MTSNLGLKPVPDVAEPGGPGVTVGGQYPSNGAGATPAGVHATGDSSTDNACTTDTGSHAASVLETAQKVRASGPGLFKGQVNTPGTKYTHTQYITSLKVRSLHHLGNGSITVD